MEGSIRAEDFAPESDPDLPTEVGHRSNLIASYDSMSPGDQRRLRARAEKRGSDVELYRSVHDYEARLRQQALGQLYNR